MTARLSLLLAAALLWSPPAWAERIVAGLSSNIVAITADFTGSEILVYGAVKRDSPVPDGPPLEVIVTVQGPSEPVLVRKKERVFGLWMNNEVATFSSVPGFYAIAASAPLADVLSQTEDLRYDITIPRAVSAVGVAGSVEDPEAFFEAMVRLREESGNFSPFADSIDLIDDTLFRADVRLPSNLTEGDYRVRFFLTRDGKVIDHHEQVILVEKAGFERAVYNLAHEQPLIYGLLALAIAVIAGWGASAAFSLIRR